MRCEIAHGGGYGVTVAVHLDVGATPRRRWMSNASSTHRSVTAGEIWSCDIVL